MRFPTPLSSIIVALIPLIFMAACASELETKMTPEQSREVFITEAKTIIQAVFPAADPLVVVEATDVPCGGPVGTSHTRVSSPINVHSDAPDEKTDPDRVFDEVVKVLKQRGWTINYTRDRVAGAERKGVGGISAGVSDSPVGINIAGETECVKNPDA